MIAHNREDGGKLVRAAWVSWATKQPAPKPSWLVPWEGLSEQDREADRCIWDEIVAPYAEVISSLHTQLAMLRNQMGTLQEKYDDLYQAWMYTEGGE